MAARVHVQENYVVVVQFPKSLRTRCREFWTLSVPRAWTGCANFLWILAIAFGCGCLLFMATLAYMWIPIIMNYCHQPPGIVMKNFSILNMAVFQSNTTSSPDSPWQVNSAFKATFSTWNKNTVAKCFTTYRRMDVRVEYKGQVILQQQIPLDFSLKPRRSRPVSVEMKGDHAQLKRDLGPLLEAELRSGSISLDFYYDFRYLIADRRSYWEHYRCVVVAKTPLESSRLGTMLRKVCYTT